MKKHLFLSLSLLAVLGLEAAPTITNVELIQQARNVKVSYTLSEPAIVEAELLSNGENLDDALLREGFRGDVFKPVAAGERSFTWRPAAAFREQVLPKFSVRLTPRALTEAPTWLVIDLREKGEARYYPRESLLLGGTHSNAAYKTTHLLLKRVKAAGEPWRMCGGPADSQRGARGTTPHLVTLSEDFYVGVYEVTQSQFLRWTSPWTFAFVGDLLPATNLSYEDLRGPSAENDWPANGHDVSETSFLGFVRSRGGQLVDLPTDAQWEFACRGGAPRQLPNGAYSEERLNRIAWSQLNSSNETQVTTHPVGLKQPNGFGLYDILGNAVELCLDWCQTRLSTENAIDPTGPYSLSVTSGKARIYKNGMDGETEDVGRVMRGGAYTWDIQYCNPTYRNWSEAVKRDVRVGVRLCAPGTARVQTPVNL